MLVGPLRTWDRLLLDGGSYVAAGGSVSHIVRTLLYGLWVSKVSSKKFGMLSLTPSKDNMNAIVELMESGLVRAVIEQTYSLDETSSALFHLGRGLSKGKLVITL